MLSVFDLFTVGLGPSSSHTVGPMRAAHRFVSTLQADGHRDATESIVVELFGSLGLTGRGHGSDRAVILGLQGERPERVDPDRVPPIVERTRTEGRLRLPGGHIMAFDAARDIIFHRSRSLPLHPNGMTFAAADARGQTLAARTYYSVGGGFVVTEHGFERAAEPEDAASPHPFRSAEELLRRCRERECSIADLMMANETARVSEADVSSRLLEIWRVMRGCIERGYRAVGHLPGGFEVARRAPALYRDLVAGRTSLPHDPSNAIDWVNLSALAVSEENASGGRIVTAPTNGAAGIVPAVIGYYERFCPGATPASIVRFLLTAGAIGILYKENASISGADVGCQGEVGVACSMAAAGLAEVLGGTVDQVENAAEIGMEHNLGLTCDPVGGLVQIPCIERNAMGAVKAINAARLALRGTGEHRVSLDKVIETMRQTGADMKATYKETSRGGLAVNVTEC